MIIKHNALRLPGLSLPFEVSLVTVMLPTFDPESMVWSGLQQPPIVNPEASLGQTLFAIMGLNPDKVIQIDADTDRTMTNGEMRLRAIRVAQNLAALGLQKGDLVAMACANSENVTPVVLALLTNGMPFNALAPGYGVDDFVHMLKLTQPKLVLCDANNYETMKKAVNLAVGAESMIYVFESELKGVNKVEDLLKETGREQMFFPPYLGDSRKQLAMILCSSGTSGLPKGVCLSHAHLNTSYGSMLGMMNGELLFNFSPLFWATGVYTLMSSLLNSKTRLITRKSFSEDLCFDLLEKYPVEWIFTPPSYVNSLLQHPRVKDVNWTSIKLWACGGSLLSEKTRNALAVLLPKGRVCNALGNSEIGGIAMEILKQKPNSVGTLLPNIRAKIVDDDGATVGSGCRGELLLKFRENILGYYKNPEATAESIDGEGWLHTGDIAHFDEEGYLFIVDRKKEILKYRNHQIAPAELEIIVEQIPGVSQVCVVGLPDGNDSASDLAAAVIIKVEGSGLSKQDVLKAVNDKVTDHKKLRGGVFFVSEFPLTPSGKVLKRELREVVLRKVQNGVHKV